MPRVKETSVALLESKLPLAIAEAWPIERLARECHCGWGAASAALRRHRAAMREVLALEPGELSQMMQKEAARARLALLDRLPRLESALDRAIEKSEEGDVKALAVAVKAFSGLWSLAKDVSGLGMAEDVARTTAVAKAKDARIERPVSLADVFVGLLPEDE